MKKLLALSAITALVFASSPAMAAKKVTVVKPAATTIIEQHANGSVDTITATPDGFTIQNGMPFVPTSVVVTPSYHRVAPITTTTTTVAPVTGGDTIVNTVDANGVPTTTVIQPTAVISSTTATPVITTPTVVVTP